MLVKFLALLPLASAVEPSAASGSSRIVDEQQTPEAKPEIHTATVAADGSVTMSG